MAQIHNTETIKRILDEAGIQTSMDDVPTQLASKVVPVLIANPPIFSTIGKDISEGSTGSTTIYTTPSDKDFYLTSMGLAYTKDAVCDNVLVNGRVTNSDGTTVQLILLPSQTTTAGNDHEILPLLYPLKLARSSNISMAGNFTAGTMNKRMFITGYLVETSKKV